jgi:hypothetical protein
VPSQPSLPQLSRVIPQGADPHPTLPRAMLLRRGRTWRCGRRRLVPPPPLPRAPTSPPPCCSRREQVAPPLDPGCNPDWLVRTPIATPTGYLGHY